MAIYFISRHKGAINWIKQQNIKIDGWMTHLDIADINAGDIIVGTLPIHLVAQLNASNIRYWHLEIKLPVAKRGQELSIDELNEFGACLSEFRVHQSSLMDGDNDL